jgi:hypothetical protein
MPRRVTFYNFTYVVPMSSTSLLTMFNSTYINAHHLDQSTFLLTSQPNPGAAFFNTAIQGSIGYSTDGNWTGMDFFDYEICTADRTICTIGRLTVIVADPESPPSNVIVRPRPEGSYSNTIYISAGPGTNPSDPDQHEVVTVEVPINMDVFGDGGAGNPTFSIVQMPQHGTLGFDNNTFFYTPLATYCGNNTLAYRNCENVNLTVVCQQSTVTFIIACNNGSDINVVAATNEKLIIRFRGTEQFLSTLAVSCSGFLFPSQVWPLVNYYQAIGEQPFLGVKLPGF